MDTAKRRVRPDCSIEGCERQQHARKMCMMHDRRAQKHGDPHVRGPNGGRPIDGKYPGWAAIHKRLFRSRGPAKRYACVDCGNRAREWSYDGTDPNELLGHSHQWTLKYSLDLERYQPRCTSCHRLFDKRILHRPGQPSGLQLLVEEVYS